MGRQSLPWFLINKVCEVRRDILCISILMTLLAFAPAMGETWRGIVIAPEHRCSPYERKRDYHYPQSLKRDIIRQIGAVYGVYTGTCFASPGQADIEHIVAMSEAHDSGLCAESRAVRQRFARDIRNLALAAPSLNRNQKRSKDAADWLPARNRCWFAERVVNIRRAYNLTIDRREAMALEAVISKCQNYQLEPLVCHQTLAVKRRRQSEDESGVLRLYDDNGNGRITCKEARRHGIAPVSRDHPAYPFMRDADGDGVVCE